VEVAMNLILRSIAFGFMTGLYSLAVTYSTVGFPLATCEDYLKAAALFIISGVGGVYAYHRDPAGAWLAGPKLTK
jgi:uncharacterized membrane protein